MQEKYVRKYMLSYYIWESYFRFSYQMRLD
jgi:hypothetical protein